MRLNDESTLIILLRELIVVTERAEYTRLRGPGFVKNNEYFISEREEIYQRILDFVRACVDNSIPIKKAK